MSEIYGGPLDGLQIAIPDFTNEYVFSQNETPLRTAAIKEDEPPEQIKRVMIIYHRSIEHPGRFEFVGYIE